MKKRYLIILLLTMFLVPFRVFASGSFNVSLTNITMYPGESKTIKISTTDSVGRLVVSSSNGGVTSVSTGQVFIETVGSSKTFTIKANSIGKATISVVGSENYGSYSDEKSLQGMTRTINVNVVERPVDNRSKNNNLKSISVDGYQLVKVNNNNYTLIVSNDVTSINVNATAEDVKAKVSGVGKYELKVGENTITVVITAENQSKNNITIKVTRKDGYYLTDLDKELQDDSKNELDIIISNDSKISNDNLEKIKNSGKKVKFNYFDENKKVLYSWIIEGSKINNLNEFVTTIVYDSENVEKISELSNYADGIYVNFKHEGNLPNNTKIKLYVGYKFKNNNLLNIYHYAGNSLGLVKDKVTVIDGYIEFELEHCSEYLITRSMLKDNMISSKILPNLSWVLIGLEFIIIVVLCLLLLKKHNLKNINEQKYKKENKVDVINVDNIFEDNNMIFINSDDS